ncbi:MAG: beta-lactamase family protein [Verrucomicrobia bacterium]|nr:beta-lactamase family protein [Verrucomicrobiota bacterium]
MASSQFRRALLTLLGLLAAGFRPSAAGADNNYTGTIAEATAWIEAQMAAQQVTGFSLALVDDQDVVWARGFGFADAALSVPVTTDTVFRIGSVSKVFTTTAALQLQDAGRLDLDDPVTNTVPGFRFKSRYPAAEAITVRHLLDYHSGLPGDLFNGNFTTQPISDRYAWITNYMASTYPIFPPAFIRSYCNAGFVLAEGVIENAHTSGLPFTAVVDQDLFQPLGMDGTSYLKDKVPIVNNLALPFVFGQPLPEEFVGMYGTGGMYSRPVDMARFIRMIFADGLAPGGARLLATNSLAEMLTAQATNVPLDEYIWMKPGLGWDTVRYPKLDYAGRVAGKGGATIGYSAVLIVLPDQKLGVAVVMNMSSMFSSLVNDTADKVLQWAVREKSGLPWPTNEVTFPTATQAVSQAELDGLAGLYVKSEGYDRLESAPGSLTWVENAHGDSPTITSNLLLRTNGWFSAGGAPVRELLFTNISGRSALVRRTADGPYVTDWVLGERYEPAPVPAAWSNRLDRTWFITDRHPASYYYITPLGQRLTLTNREGVLMAVHDASGARVLSPSNDNVAFIVGLDNRGGSAVQVYDLDGKEHVQYYGYQHAPAPDEVEANTTVTSAVTTAHWSAWHAIQPAVEAGGLLYELRLENAPSNFLLRLFQSDSGTLLVTAGVGETLRFTAPQSPLYPHVQPMLCGAQTGAFELVYNYPLLVRRVRASDTGDVVVTWQGLSNTEYRLCAADALDGEASFQPVQTQPPCPAMLMSLTNTPAPAGRPEFYRIEVAP